MTDEPAKSLKHYGHVLGWQCVLGLLLFLQPPVLAGRSAFSPLALFVDEAKLDPERWVHVSRRAL